jgi:hypothetical protein
VDENPPGTDLFVVLIPARGEPPRGLRLRWSAAGETRAVSLSDGPSEAGDAPSALQVPGDGIYTARLVGLPPIQGELQLLLTDPAGRPQEIWRGPIELPPGDLASGDLAPGDLAPGDLASGNLAQVSFRLNGVRAERVALTTPTRDPHQFETGPGPWLAPLWFALILAALALGRGLRSRA